MILNTALKTNLLKNLMEGKEKTMQFVWTWAGKETLQDILTVTALRRKGAWLKSSKFCWSF